ncbi:MAG TPA: hypothetical protein VKY65_03005 [Alphaproteobacteria bacterium]|nr:hypothetical protein [Alphaproteobacteria bacterium]
MPDMLGYYAPEDAIAIFAGLLLAVMAGIGLIACRRAKRYMMRQLHHGQGDFDHPMAGKAAPKAH